MATKYKILYKTNTGKMYYVSDYTVAKLDNGTKVLGGCKLSPNLTDAKIIPNDIYPSNIMDKSIGIIEVNTPAFI